MDGIEQDNIETHSMTAAELNAVRQDEGSRQDAIETRSVNAQGQCTSEVQGSARMKRAYGLCNSLVRDRLENEGQENLELLDDIKASDILVVSGSYDHIHLVLSNLNIPFLNTEPKAITVQELRPEQTIFVNCSRDFPSQAAKDLEKFVSAGGQMISTDWALKNVLEVGFPGYVRFNKRATEDEVVGIEVLSKKDPVLTGFFDEESDPVWWLEASSYPIEVLDKDKVEVLVRSEELGEKYGADPVIIKFAHGEGVVYHMISHFYLQRTETRDAKQQQKASVYALRKGASPATMATFQASEKMHEEMDYGLTQSVMTSAEFVSRSILSQKRKFLQKTRKLENNSEDE
jgi:hypothetical protein